MEIFDIKAQVLILLQVVINFLASLSLESFILVGGVTPIFLHSLYGLLCLRKIELTPIRVGMRKIGVFLILFLILIMASGIYGNNLFFEEFPDGYDRFRTQIFQPAISIYLKSIVIASGLYLIGLFTYFRVLDPLVNKMLRRWIKPISENSKVPEPWEVRDVFKFIKNAININKFIKRARLKNSIFLGLDDKNKPIYVDRKKWNKSNIQIIGIPGAGKGVSASIQLLQAIKYGDMVIVLAPKEDEYAYSFYRSVCDSEGVNFTYVDLRNNNAQLNPLLNINSPDFYELFISLFNLNRNGEINEVYLNHERNALRRISSIVEGENFTLKTLLMRTLEILNLNKENRNLIQQLEELSEVSALNTVEGPNLAKLIENKGCIFIQGSTRNESTILALKLLQIRFIQLIENRKNKDIHVSIFADELKYQFTTTLVNSLGTIRDKNAHILLAHQSLGDLEVTSLGLNPNTVKNTIIDNCSLRWVYECQDFETASWVSQLCGTKSVFQPHVSAAVNPLLAEKQQLASSSSLVEMPIIHPNIVQNLPEFSAVCIGVKPGGVLAYIKPLPVEKVKPQILEQKKSVLIDEESLL